MKAPPRRSRARRGSITYNEWSYAKSQGLQVAKIVTSAGPEPVEIGTEIGRQVDRAVKIKGEGNDLVLDTATFYMPTEAGSYPIMLATYEIVCSKYADAEVATAVKAFLTSAVGRRPEGPRGQRVHPDPGHVQEPAGHRHRRDLLRETVTAMTVTPQTDCGGLVEGDEPTAGRDTAGMPTKPRGRGVEAR